MASHNLQRLKRIIEASGLNKEQVVDYMEIVEKLIEESEWKLTPEEIGEEEGRIWTPEEIEALVRDCKRMAA